MLTIGIDPGKNTGIAYAENGKITRLETLNFWGAIKVLENHKHAAIRLELPATKAVWHNGATSKKAIQRTGVNVGSCLREAELIYEYLVMNGFNYRVVKPQGKIDAKRFNLVTGWTGQSNQHTRDAGMLALMKIIRA